MISRNELFRKLHSNYVFDKRHNLYLSFLEAFLGLIAGGFVGSCISAFNTRDCLFGCLTASIFLYLFYRRTSKEQDFSVSSLGELEATIELDSCKKNMERKKFLDTYLNDAVKSLNSNTCNYIPQNVLVNLCDSSIETGFKDVFKPFIENPQNLFATERANFTVGVCLRMVSKLPPDLGVAQTSTLYEDDLYVVRDDLKLSQLFVKDMLVNGGLFETSYKLQSQFLDTFKHFRFIHSQVEGYSVVTAPIPVVCADDSSGLLFVITEKITSLPLDVAEVTLIFSRLFANWLSRYEECVNQRCEKANQELAKGGAAPPADNQPPQILESDNSEQGLIKMIPL